MLILERPIFQLLSGCERREEAFEDDFNFIVPLGEVFLRLKIKMVHIEKRFWEKPLCSFDCSAACLVWV